MGCDNTILEPRQYVDFLTNLATFFEGLFFLYRIDQSASISPSSLGPRCVRAMCSLQLCCKSEDPQRHNSIVSEVIA